MKLVVGTNSYMTLDEANNIVTENFTSTDSTRIYWNSLSDDDKSILVYKATKNIDTDSAMYIGKKVDLHQKMQFPRSIYNPATNNILECPDDIKIGIILQMMQDIKFKTSDSYNLISNGIKSFSDGAGASVTVDTSFNSNKLNNVDRSIWTELFSPYSLLSV